MYTYNYIIAVEVSVKPANSPQITTKRAVLKLTRTVPALDRIEDLLIDFITEKAELSML